MGSWKVFEIKAIRTRDWSKRPKAVRTNILNALKDQAEIGIKYLNQTVEYWEFPPKFQYKMRYAGGNIRLLLFPSTEGVDPVGMTRGERPDPVPLYKKWMWLNYGTRRRYAHMTRDWVSKTDEAGSLGTNVRGVGLVSYVGRPAVQGIRARRWDRLIKRVMRKGFTQSMDDAIRKGMREGKGK